MNMSNNVESLPPRVLLVIGQSQTGNTISPPVGLYKLRHYLSQRDIPCEVLSIDIHDPDVSIDQVRKGQYDVVGFSLSHWSLSEDFNLVWKFREAAEQCNHNVFFIAGGQEAAMNSAQCLDMGIDLIFLGFAENSLYHFCRNYRLAATTDMPLHISALAESINGVVFRKGSGEMVFRNTGALTQDYFHEISYKQALTLEVPYHDYWNKLRALQSDTTLGSEFVFEFVRLYTASHCPRRCGFCNSQSFLPVSQGCHPKIIHLSGEEIAHLVLHHIEKYGAKGFFFSDDDFPLGNRSGIERVTRFCDLIIQYKTEGTIDGSIRFSCQARIADFLERTQQGQREVNLEILHKMHAAGFRSIALGVETFSDRLLRTPSINKIGVNSKNCFEVIDAMLNIGLVPLMNIILGIPEATVEELLQTLRVAVYYVTQGCEINVTGPMYALPGAPILEGGKYNIQYTEWRHPITQEVFKISDYLVPNDPVVADVSANYEILLTEELLELSKKYHWEGKIPHKRAKNILAIIVATKLLGDLDLAEALESILDALINRKLTANMGASLIEGVKLVSHATHINNVVVTT